MLVRNMVAARHTFAVLVPAHPLGLISLKKYCSKSRNCCRLLFLSVLKQISFIEYILSFNLYFVDLFPSIRQQILLLYIDYILQLCCKVDAGPR